MQLLELGNQPRPRNKALVLLACTTQVLQSAEIGLGNTHARVFSRLDLPDESENGEQGRRPSGWTAATSIGQPAYVSFG